MTSSYGADRPHRRRRMVLAGLLFASFFTGCAELDPALIVFGRR